jgi:hypothetical protein
MIFSIAWRALGVFRWLKQLAISYPWQAALILAVVFGLWQRHEAQEAEDARKACATMYAGAVKAGNDAKAKAEAQYRSMAHAADKSYQAGRADGSARLAAYIAANRLRPAQANPTGPAKSGDPRLPESPASGPVVAQVAISEADITTCDVLYDYAKAAHGWAQELKGSNDGS